MSEDCKNPVNTHCADILNAYMDAANIIRSRLPSASPRNQIDFWMHQIGLELADAIEQRGREVTKTAQNEIT